MPEPIAFVHEADFYCLYCAAHQFTQGGGWRDIGELATDSEGRPIIPVFSEWCEHEPGYHTLDCCECGRELDHCDDGGYDDDPPEDDYFESDDCDCDDCQEAEHWYIGKDEVTE